MKKIQVAAVHNAVRLRDGFSTADILHRAKKACVRVTDEQLLRR